MASIRETNFVVTDVETTGSDPKMHRITEIGCVTARSGLITEKYTTLANPHQAIPEFIQKMTGITDAMVRRAPEFVDAIPGIKAMFRKPDTIFVAHNSEFDYRFVKASFERSGFVFECEKLCSLKLARKLLPTDIKKNVGSLANFFGIPIISRHRALDDAEATAYILLELLNIAENEHDILTTEELLDFQNRTQRTFKPKEEVLTKLSISADNFPYGQGLLIFKNLSDDILFVSKSSNLRATVVRMIVKAENQSKKIADMISATDKVEYIECASDLHLELDYFRILNESSPPFNITPPLNGANNNAVVDEPKLDALKSIQNLENLLGKDFIKKIAESIAPKKEVCKDIAVVINDNEHNYLCDVFLICDGNLHFHKTIGKKSELTEIHHQLDLMQKTQNGGTDKVEWDIISMWLDKRRNQSTVIELKGKDIQSIAHSLEKAIRS
ncbi:MAG: exonuclease domain-containing protein [Candidatus Kapabacteria bacterium]|nr:exonuclease domain-containing protein [Candidatus Kapabacteria bacterium]